VWRVCLCQDVGTDPAARAALERAGGIYGRHMGAGLEEHGIRGTPDQVVERIRRHVALGCTLFVTEFFGRDTREPARLFAERVMPAFRELLLWPLSLAAVGGILHRPPMARPPRVGYPPGGGQARAAPGQPRCDVSLRWQILLLRNPCARPRHSP